MVGIVEGEIVATQRRVAPRMQEDNTFICERTLAREVDEPVARIRRSMTNPRSLACGTSSKAALT